MNKRNNKVLSFVIGIALVCFVGVVFRSIWSKQIEHIIKTANEKYSNENIHLKARYRLYFMNLPLGYLNLEKKETQYERRNVYKIHLNIRPFNLFKIISLDNIGIDFTALIDKNRLLPYRFEQSDLYSTKRGKSPRTIVYHHEDLFIERKGNAEDIQDDTRDPVSIILWLMSQDYENTQFIKSTLNINRTIYVVVGKVKDGTSLGGRANGPKLVELKLKILQLDRGFNPVNTFPMTVYLVKKGKIYLPVRLDIRKFGLPFNIVLI